jgi:transposase InsO family protein
MTKRLMTAVDSATERFNLIAPLLSDGLDKGRRYDLTREIADRHGVSERTLRRYVRAFKEGGFEALKPKQGWKRPDNTHGADFDRVVEAATELRRESPSRSVSDIIKILELEGAIEPGSVARSTLQRHLQSKGYGSSQIRMYTKKGVAARRFKKEHRGELYQSDIKFGPYLKAENGRKKQIFLVTWLDNATRFAVCCRFYINQESDAIEDSLYRAIQNYGAPDKIFTDNGGVYRSKWINRACAKLGVRLLKARPYHPEANGAAEAFNRAATRFISEAVLKKPQSLAEYNELLRLWLDEYYHKNPHSGNGGVSPAAAFGTDNRPLKFVPANILKDAFMHTETRKVDKTGCISFNGNLYEVGAAYAARKVEINFHPAWTEEVEVVHEGTKPFIAKKLVIGRNCGVSREIPEYMKTKPPETSRLLDGLKKQKGAKPAHPEIVTTFKSYWEKGGSHV